DHVDGAIGQRGHIKVAVRTGNDVGADAEVLAGYEARALALVKLVVVVIDLVAQPRVAEGEVLPAVVELELKQIAAVEEGPGGADEQIARVLRSEPATPEADSRRRHGPFPAELGVVIVRAGQNEEPRQGLTRRIRQVRRREAQLLECRDERGRVDGAEGQVAGDRQVALKR